MKTYNFMGEDKVKASKVHNFMVYEAVKHILLSKKLASKMNCLIEDGHITKEKNPFFLRAKQTPRVSVESALTIAFNWHEITKEFMTTVLISLGNLADKVTQVNFSYEYAISASKTGIRIIFDDLSHLFSEIEEKNSTNIDGVHSVWWERNVLKPLLAATNNKHFSSHLSISPKAGNLLKEMNKLTKNPLGFVVQLYVIEIIALDIILAFLPLFRDLEAEGQKIFKSSEVISWIMAHIEDKDIHQPHENLSDNAFLNIVSTLQDQKNLLHLAPDYIRCWSAVLMEFHDLLDKEPIDYYSEIGIASGNRMLQ